MQPSLEYMLDEEDISRISSTVLGSGQGLFIFAEM